MSYVIAARDFFIRYDVFILPVAFALVWVFGVINFCKNCYRKQNKKINACRAKLLKNNSQAALVMCYAPAEYRRQWRAFVASGAQKPSQTFEFVPHKNRKSGALLVALGAVVACVYLAIFVWDTSRYFYVAFSVAFWLAFAIVMVVDKLLFRRKEKRARQTFGKFVAQLNAVVAMQNDDAVTDTARMNAFLPKQSAMQQKTVSQQRLTPQHNSVAQQIKNIKHGDNVGASALQKASQVLRQNGLNGTRTAHEQRQINYALNGLLQAYSRNGSVNLS